MSNNRIKTDPAILSARRRQREMIRNEWERSDKHAEDVARNALWRAERDSKGVDLPHAVSFATSKLCSAVMNSMDVRAGIHVNPFAYTTTAYTDFNDVYIGIARGSYNIDDPKDVARLIHFTKGLLYHEIGHIKFTTSPLTLLKYVGSGIEGVSSAYGVTWGEFRMAWNSLEDQRMECAMVRYSNIMRVYFTTIVIDYVTASANNGAWFLVTGRTYLPKDVLDVFRKRAKEVSAATDPSLVADTSSLVSRYKRATDPADMVRCVVDYAGILSRWKALGVTTPTDRSHDSHGQSTTETVDKRLSDSATDEPPGADDPSPSPSPGDASDSDASDSDASDSTESTKGKGAGTDSEGTDSEGTDSEGTDTGTDDVSDSGDGDDAGELTGGRNETDNSDGPAGGKGASHSDTGPSNPTDQTTSSDDDILRDALNQSLDNSPITGTDVNSFMSDANGELGNSLPHNGQTTKFCDEDLVKVEEVFNGMMATLEPLAVQADPAWRFRQEQGILDPTAFSLREPGASDYWCDLDDIGGTGFDLAVTVTLDVSGSMLYMSRDVGIAALGIRKACDALGVPCTVSTFSDVGELLWAADEEPEDVFPYAKGGTNPLRILETLDDYRFGKSKHLVIALTDGAWSGVDNLAPYSAPGRLYYVVGIGGGMDHTIGRLGADACAVISRPEDFAEQATRALTGFFM